MEILLADPNKVKYKINGKEYTLNYFDKDAISFGYYMTKTSKGEFYRVSIGAKNVDGGYYFDDRISAIKYCDYIKKYKLNCFVVDNELVNLKNK